MINKKPSVGNIEPYKSYLKQNTHAEKTESPLI